MDVGYIEKLFISNCIDISFWIIQKTISQSVAILIRPPEIDHYCLYVVQFVVHKQ